MAAQPNGIARIPHSSLVEKFAARYFVEAPKLLATLKATAFRVDSGEVSNEQMMALLVVADQYKLNPFTKEIFAFPDSKKGIVPILSIDGWARIINEHPQFDGVEFIDGPAHEGGAPEWIECVIYRKDRAHPARIRERMKECKRGTGPWGSHPSRMLRHKALIQCARVAFGFAGIYDQDEAERIIERDITPARTVAAERAETARSRSSTVAERVRRERSPIEAEPVDTETGEVKAQPGPASSAEATDDPDPPPADEAKALHMLDGCETREAADELIAMCTARSYAARLVEARDKRFPPK